MCLLVLYGIRCYYPPGLNVFETCFMRVILVVGYLFQVPDKIIFFNYFGFCLLIDLIPVLHAILQGQPLLVDIR